MARTRIKTSIQTEFEAGRLKGKGRIKNIGENGLFVGTAAIPDQGETVQLQFIVPGGARVEVTGLVWWTTLDEAEHHRTQGFGFRLLEENSSYQRAVETLLR